MAKSQPRLIAPPDSVDKELKNFSSVLQDNFLEVFQHLHDHKLVETSPTERQGVTGDLWLYEDEDGTKKFYGKYRSGWAEIAASSASSSNAVDFKNLIINGDMRIDQRNAGAAYTINSSTAVTTLDRWKASGQSADGVFTVQRQTASVPVGFTEAIKVTVTTTDTSIGSTQTYYIRHNVEGLNTVKLLQGTTSAKTVTLSFWVRASIAGTYSGSFKNSAANRSYPFTFIVAGVDTWEKKAITVVLDKSGTWLTTTGIGLSITFDLGSGTSVRGIANEWAGSDYNGATGAVSLIGTNNATFYLTGVQLEEGTAATDFDYRPYGVQVLLCQRYYEKSYDLETAVNTVSSTGVHQFKAPISDMQETVYFFTPKRVTPTMTYYNPVAGGTGTWRDTTAGANKGVNTVTSNTEHFTWQNSSGFTVNSAILGHWAADAEL